MKNYFVYVLCDPTRPGTYGYEGVRTVFEFEPFYVGKGKGNRPQQHAQEARRGGKSHKLNRIRKILASGKEPIVVQSRLVTEQEALAEEVRLIGVLGRRCRGGVLVNATNGGDGVSGHVHSSASRKKMSEAQKRISEEQPEIREQQFGALQEARKDPCLIQKAYAKARTTKAQPESKAKAANAARKFWKEASPEAKALRETRRLASLASMSQEDREGVANKKRATRESKGPDWAADVQRRRRKALDARSDEEKAAHKAKIGAASAARHRANQESTFPDAKLRQFRKLLATGKYSVPELAQRFAIPYQRANKIAKGKERPDVV